jgi:UDP-N-acetylglucosamine diphosphorylase/glucosamine-1-phosphate N-acetyltransferase
MKEIILNDHAVRGGLFPFTLVRHVSDIRIGILTIREKWQLLLKRSVAVSSAQQTTPSDVSVFPANIIPTKEYFEAISQNIETGDRYRSIQYPWHIFQLNDWALRKDFEILTAQRVSDAIPKNVQVTNHEDIFIEPGATLSNCILNASTGPIYIGKNAEIMEGAIIRGPFALCEGAVVKMGTRIYGATTIGPYSVVGGEVKNSVIFGYSNKAHDGYLGDSVIGEWCNLGAGTSNSNVKNNAGEIKTWNPSTGDLESVGIKCGLLMGDYSRSAINTSFNTGTTVGVCCNVFGEGLTPIFIPNFSWGYKPIEKYEFEKAIRDISNWKRLKGKSLMENEITELKNIFNQL